eukprot:g13250.t1
MTRRAAIISLLTAVTSPNFLLVRIEAASAAAEQHLAGAGMPQGLMSRRSMATTSSTDCATEKADCFADATCAACFNAFSVASDTCFARASSCVGAQEGFCCAITAEEDEDCQGSDLVIEVLECFVGPFFSAVGCDLDTSSDCSLEGASSSASTLGMPVLFWTTAAAVAGLLSATLGVVV